MGGFHQGSLERDKGKWACGGKRAKEAIMSTALWMNIPLMVLAFALWVGVPLWLVLRRPDWRGKPESRIVPAYLARRAAPVQVAMVRVPGTAGYHGRSMRPLTGGANG
jgi:hypothetical protein